MCLRDTVTIKYYGFDSILLENQISIRYFIQLIQN